MNPTETKTREAICRLGASIFGRGLTPGSSGNISARIDDGWLMTPTNVSLGDLDPATLSKLDDQGRLVSGHKETKESFLHLAVYDVRANDKKLAEAVRAAAHKHHAVLLANHGPVVAGSSLSTAAAAVEELEETARLHLLLQGHATRLLTPEQVTELREAFPS